MLSHRATGAGNAEVSTRRGGGHRDLPGTCVHWS